MLNNALRLPLLSTMEDKEFKKNFLQTKKRRQGGY